MKGTLIWIGRIAGKTAAKHQRVDLAEHLAVVSKGCNLPKPWLSHMQQLATQQQMKRVVPKAACSMVVSTTGGDASLWHPVVVRSFGADTVITRPRMIASR
jgi:putative copper export protein